jgi:hypothetical protein
MSEAANIDSIDVLKDIKLSLLKFQEAATVSLGDAESETHRVLMWIQTEQDSFWQHQIRKREEIVTRCKEAVRMKKVFKDATGRQQSAIDEEKALKIALRNLEEAQQKLKLVRKWARQLPKEIENYKGSVQRFATTVESQIPTAIGHLEKLAKKIDAYLSVQAPSFDGAIGTGGALGSAPGQASMGRGSAISGGIAPDEITRLKGLLATPEIRATAPIVTDVKLQAPTIPAEHQAPAMLPVTERRHPPADAKVLVATFSSSAGRLFLHHAEPVVPNDSGWSILPADATADLQWEAIRFADLLAARPDMADLLGLPVRFSVMIDSSGVSDVADAQQPAWRRT